MLVRRALECGSLLPLFSSELARASHRSNERPASWPGRKRQQAAALHMSHKTGINILTCIVILALLGVFVYKRRSAMPQKENENAAESAIWRMLEAARTADVERYLSCYTGETAALLQKNVQEMGVAGFSKYLSNSMRQVKGIAVFSPEENSTDERRLSVEYIYEDRNEVQQYYLRQVGKEWKIFRIESAERVKTLVPYGAPATE